MKTIRETFQQIVLFDTVTVLRALACCVIVMVHSPLDTRIFTTAPGILLGGILHASIRMFFILSGYVLVQGFRNGAHTVSLRKVVRFTLRRLMRMYPLYVLVILVLYGQIPHVTSSHVIDTVKLLTFTSTPGSRVAGYLWFMTTLFWLNVGTPFLYAFMKRHEIVFFRYPLLSSAMLVMMWALGKYILLPFVSSEFLYSSPLMVLDMYGVGMIIGYNRNHDTSIRRFGEKIVGITSLLAIGIISWTYALRIEPDFTTRNQAIYESIYIPIAAMCIAIVMIHYFCKTVRISAITNPLMVPWFAVVPVMIVGIFSYEIYLIHQVILRWWGASCAPCTMGQYASNVGTVIGWSIALGIIWRLIYRLVYIVCKLQIRLNGQGVVRSIY